MDGGAWTRGTSLTVSVPRKTAVAVVHTLEYRSADAAGNVETAHFGQVKIDSVKPVTNSNADGLAHAGSFTLILAPKDADSGLSATYMSVDGGAYKDGHVGDDHRPWPARGEVLLHRQRAQHGGDQERHGAHRLAPRASGGQDPAASV